MKKKMLVSLFFIGGIGCGLFTSCGDSNVEQERPVEPSNVTSANIPSVVKKVIANYEDVKKYTAQYAQSLKVGVGATAGFYNSDKTYMELTNSNFQMITLGNAMKMDAIVTSTGDFNFYTLDAFLEHKPAEVELYGHNFLWHSQQPQDYLLSLIKPSQANSSKNYVLKSDAEKKAIITAAMENWIKGMANHLAEKKVVPYGYDVINEPIMDGSNLLRGVDKGVFNGTDTEPVETVENGLSLNWASGHWYWGYYIGKEYGILAFQFARKYLPATTKLFINDYNLEMSPNKLNALIQFVKYIDAANGTPIVDGIGTQMHLQLRVTCDDDFKTQITNLIKKVKQSFTTLAATGKYIRVTELDIALGAASPNSLQLKAQYEAYHQIFKLYKEIIPQAQQSGITIWGLSDKADEHIYWLPNESPNIFDQNYKRKWAFKGVCDGIAGEDLGLKYGGDEYKAYYEKNHTTDW